MALYNFQLEYDDKRQTARLTNVPTEEDPYVCGFDIVFTDGKDKRDLKEGLTAIVTQLQKPSHLRGAEDRTPVEVKANLKSIEDLTAELEATKAELEKAKNA